MRSPSNRSVVEVELLGLVELVMTIEETFGFAISDSDAEQLWTIGDLKRYVRSRVPARASSRCSCQRAFHRLRAVTCEVLGVSKRRVRPRTRWSELLPENGRRRAWRRVAKKARLPHLVYWRLGCLDLAPIRRWDVPALRPTVGSAARLLAATKPVPRRRRDAAWSRDEISRVIDHLVIEICKVSDFSDETRLVD